MAMSDPCGPRPLLGHISERIRCASGCGEVYMGEWFADPPTCDPCDCHGNWIGPRDCCPTFWQKLWGTRYDGGCGCGDVGCDSCCGDHHHGDYHGELYHGGEIYHGGEVWHDGPVHHHQGLHQPLPPYGQPTPAGPEPGAAMESVEPTPDEPMTEPMPEPMPEAQPMPSTPPLPPESTWHRSPRRFRSPFQRTSARVGAPRGTPSSTATRRR